MSESGASWDVSAQNLSQGIFSEAIHIKISALERQSALQAERIQALEQRVRELERK
jgi:hypothetical protein